MNFVETNEAIEELIRNNEMVLIYFGGKGCDVCSVLKPKLEKMLDSYSKIKSVEVDVEKALRVAAAYNIFTIPGVIVFVDGKETIREARYISIEDLNNKISRYYDMLFN